MQSFQVPQYIEEESRLVGSLTFSQVLILVIGGGLTYLAYTLLAAWISLAVIILLGSITVIMAFVQVDGMPTYKLVMPLIRHLWLPRTYIWRKPIGGSSILKEEGIKDQTITLKTPIVQKKKVDIAKLTKTLNKERINN